MDIEVYCPICGAVRIPFSGHLAMIVLSPALAIYRFACPSCDGTLAVPYGIPAAERAVARHALASIGADDGRRTWPDAIAPWYSALAARPSQGGCARDASRATEAGIACAHEEWELAFGAGLSDAPGGMPRRWDASMRHDDDSASCDDKES